MNEPVRIGIIGAGRIGRLHAENLVRRARGATVTAIADVVLEAAQDCAAAFSIPEAVADPRTLLEDRGIDAVFICSSTDTHATLIEEAATCGKHVFCEKPIALDLPAIDRALGAAARAGILLQIGFNRRFDAGFRRAHDLIAAGAIGRPEILRITSRDPAPPPSEYVKVSGGIFLDMMIHDFDMARFVMGDEVEEVFAVGAVLVDPAIGAAGDVDTAAVMLRFAGGAIGVIDNSRRAVYGYDQRLEVHASKGRILVENPKPDQVIRADAAGDHGAPLYRFFLDRYTEAYVAEAQTFVDALVAGREPPVTGHDGRTPVVMGHAARLSLETGRPVRLTDVASGPG